MEELIKEWWYLQKKYNFTNKFIAMDLTLTLPLPLDQLRFNLVLRILITAYGISWMWNFFASIPGCNEEDAEILWCNRNWNYSFRLISSLIFFLLWISQFRYPWLIYLSIIQIYITIIIYIWLIIKEHRYSKANREKKRQIKKKYDELTGKQC